MRVQLENRTFKVYYEDDEHYYVKMSDDEPVNGYLKTQFKVLDKFYQRPDKLKRILNEPEQVEEKYLFDYDWNNAKIKVDWSGSYPALCSGTWSIFIDEMELPIPESPICSNMGTYGVYSSWHFNDDWSEEFEDYDDGESFSEWIEEDGIWLIYSLKNLADFYSLKLDYNTNFLERIYSKINECDFRGGSCGGCI